MLSRFESEWTAFEAWSANAVQATKYFQEDSAATYPFQNFWLGMLDADMNRIYNWEKVRHRQHNSISCAQKTVRYSLSFFPQFSSLTQPCSFVYLI